MLDNDSSWEFSRRNFRADISFKEHNTEQTIIDYILTIQNKFPTHFEDRFLSSTLHQSLLTHVTSFTKQAMSMMAVEALIFLKWGIGFSALVTQMTLFFQISISIVCTEKCSVQKKKRFSSSLSLLLLAFINPSKA